MKIEKVAVLGSGVMGSGIASLIANSGVPVMLLDIVPQGATDRNVLTATAVQKQLKSEPSGFTHPANAKRVYCGNLEDDLSKLAEADWIIEVVLEKIEVKQEVYRKVDAVRKPGSIVSSNTSTLPLHALTNGMPEHFKKDFFITHFFNPPRFMRLLELVGGPESRKDAYEAIRRFADITLGKEVVIAKDTPGFLANRIGVFWMMAGLLEAIKLGISVEEADSVMGKPVGIPKTGVFGLFDLIGIDLMPLIAKAMMATLPKDDPFRALYHEPELVKKMIADGYTGRKGKGGFYRINKEGGKKVKESIDLKTGAYHPAKETKLESVAAAKLGLKALLGHPDIGGQYASAVMGQTLAYAASLIPQISDDLPSVDIAMKTGYNWKYGPFELVDRLGDDKISGVSLLAGQLKQRNLPVPKLLEDVGNQPFYKTEGGKRLVFDPLSKSYKEISTAEGVLPLFAIQSGKKPIIKNPSAQLWDMGDGVALVEFKSKMNSIDPDILTLISQSLDTVQKSFRGMVIGGEADNFSVGANLGLMLFCANTCSWNMLSDMIRQGQNTLMAMKYAPFPVVSALSGMALGGGCEIVLHSDAVQAHMESYPGLVEAGVGLIPGWGGCKELLFRNMRALKGGPMPGISKAFEAIMMAKVAGSADHAKEMMILNEKSRITMNRARLLADAKQLCLQLAENYTPPEQGTVTLPGESGKVALEMAVQGFVDSGKATVHDAVIGRHLAVVLTGGEEGGEMTEQNILDLEHQIFMQLAKTPATLARIEHMLNTGKPLRN